MQLFDLTKILGSYTPIEVATIGGSAIALDIPYIVRAVVLLTMLKFAMQTLAIFSKTVLKVK